MNPRRAPRPIDSRQLAGAPRRGIVSTDPAGRAYIVPYPEDGEGGLSGSGEFIPMGNVFGDATVVDQRIAVFDGDGFHIEDGGMTIAELLALISGAGTGDVIGPSSAVDDRIATFDGTTGKLIQDGGQTIAQVIAAGAAAALAGWTTKQVPYADATGTLVGNTAKLALDHVNNRLGVGVASPSTALDVRGTPVDIGYLISARPSGSGNAFLQLLANGAANAAGFAFTNQSLAGEWRMFMLGNTSNVLRWAFDSTPLFWMSQALNIILGAGPTLKDPTTGTYCFVVQNGTAPTAVASDTVALFANDVSASSQLHAMNEAGQRVQLTAPAETITCVFDGGGVAITTGDPVFVQVPFACVVTAWRIVADQVGSIVVDVWKDSYANFPPTVADTITAAAKPTLSSAQKNQDTTLTGWTTAIAAGDYLAFSVDSAATVERVTVQLIVRRGT